MSNFDQNHIAQVSKVSGLSLGMVYKCLSAHYSLLANSDPEDMNPLPSYTEQWWSIFGQLVTLGTLTSGQDYRVDGNTLYLRWSRCHTSYLLHHRATLGERGVGSKPLLDMLRLTPGFSGMVKSMKMEGSNTSAVAFMISRLPGAVNNALCHE
jgi:hypothetical protein